MKSCKGKKDSDENNLMKRRSDLMMTVALNADRLDSPLPLVRQMAKRVALAFSLVINPDNPLHLDDEEEVCDLDDWEGLERKAAAREVEQAHVASDSQAKLDASKIKNVVISNNVRPGGSISLPSLLICYVLALYIVFQIIICLPNLSGPI